MEFLFSESMLIQKLLVFGIVCQCYYSQETVYKFWTGNMNQITCNKTKTDFMNYSQQFMKTECNVTFEDGNQIPRRTLCHAITLVSGLICDDLSVSVSNISKLLAQSITANKSCGDDGIRKYQHIELLQKDTNSAISENLKKILNNCTQSCSAMPNVCATFVKFCQIAFEATSAGRKVPLVNTTKAMKANAVQIMTTTSQPKPQVAPSKAEENQPTRSNADASSQNNMPVNYYNPSDSGTFLGDHMYLILLSTLSCIIFYILLLKKNRVIAFMLEGRRPQPKKYTRVSLSGYENTIGGSRQSSEHSPQLFKTTFDSDDEVNNAPSDFVPMLKDY